MLWRFNSVLSLSSMHNLDKEGVRLLGVLMQVIGASHSRMIVISRSSPDFYDRRDVMTRGRVAEIALGGLSRNELEMLLVCFVSGNWDLLIRCLQNLFTLAATACLVLATTVL